MTDHREQLRALADALPLDGAAMVPVAWLRELLSASASPERVVVDLTVADLATRVGRKPSCVRGWCEQGLIPGAYKLNRREWRIPPASVEAFQAEQRGGGVRTAVRDSGEMGDWRKARSA